MFYCGTSGNGLIERYSRGRMRRFFLKTGFAVICPLVVSLAAAFGALAQVAQSNEITAQTLARDTSDPTTQAQQTSTDGPAAPATTDAESNDLLTMFPHSETSRYWISGQANVVFQWHSRFPAPYTGPNSLTPWPQSATTHILTLYTGYELTHTTEVFCDIEYATGGGIGTALGLAGYTNLDSVRTVSGITLSRAPYLARLMLRQIIPLSTERITVERGPLALATSLPARRIEFRIGKFDLVDFFDLNIWGSDSHLQFLNWTVDNDGAFDYAANTRGYTDGAILEYDDHWFSARFAVAMMPKVANGINLDADIARARGENLELDAAGNLLLHRPGTVRFLAYLNIANMGNYEESNKDFLDGQGTAPNIIATRRQGRHKYGFDLNVEQDLPAHLGVFGRAGWSDGRNESFAYTEVDRTAELGIFTKGDKWQRKNDRAGAAVRCQPGCRCSPAVPRLWRPGVHPRRWPPHAGYGKNRRRILHRSSLARTLRVLRSSARQ